MTIHKSDWWKWLPFRFNYLYSGTWDCLNCALLVHLLSVRGDSVRLRIDGTNLPRILSLEYRRRVWFYNNLKTRRVCGFHFQSCGLRDFWYHNGSGVSKSAITIDGPSMVCFGDSVPLTCTRLSGNEIVRYRVEPWTNHCRRCMCLVRFLLRW